MTRGADIYLLTIRGTLASPSLEAARPIHNETAGAPANVAAARSLGDLSHKVWVAAPGSAGAAPNELLVTDLWNDLQGLGQFFANPQVQEQAGRIFAARDPVVWARAEGFHAYHLPTPAGRNDRFLGLIRGTVRSREAARETLRAGELAGINEARRLGQLSHEVYWRMTPPGEPASSELCGVDVWSSLDGMREFYGKESPAIGDVFAAPPATSIWAQAPGAWVEW